jgi:hypothetical protein
MSAIREKLVKRLTRASVSGRGVEITKGYSATWRNEAKKLQDEKKVEYRGGKLFLVK